MTKPLYNFGGDLMHVLNESGNALDNINESLKQEYYVEQAATERQQELIAMVTMILKQYAVAIQYINHHCQ